MDFSHKDNKWNYRLIVLDIDGTIADKNHVISQKTREAIKLAVNSGFIVTIATGRMRLSAQKYAQQCRINGPLICYQGALIIDSNQKSILRHYRLNSRIVSQSLMLMRNSSAHISLFLEDQIFVEDSNPWARDYAKRMGVKLNTITSLDKLTKSEPTVILASNTPNKTKLLADTVADRLKNTASVTHSLPHFCEVTALYAQKHIALQYIAQIKRVDASQIIAIGDGPGDIGMIKWAGLGIAVKDAHPMLLNVANKIIPGPENNGVADFISRIIKENNISR